MFRCIFYFTLLLLTGVALSACQLDKEEPLLSFLAQPTDTPIPTPTNTPTATYTPTNPPTPTPSPTPSDTPTPTATLMPSDRLAAARRAYTNGNYEAAWQEFATLLTDPGANPDEQSLALHWRGRSELQLGNYPAAIATLKLFLEQYPADKLARAAQFNLAVAYEQNGQLNEATKTYLGAIIPDDPINAYIYERIGDIALQANQYDNAIDAYQIGIESSEDIGFQVHLREGIADAELRKNNPAGAITQYEVILDVAKIEDYRAKILRLVAEAHLAADEPEAAYARYLEAVNNYPEAHDSYLSLIELVNAEAPVDEFQRGLVDYYAAAYQPAIVAFDRYLNQPQPAKITTTNTLTETTFSSPLLVETLPSPKVGDAVWYIALCWQQLGQYNNAIAFLRRLIDEHPNHNNWGRAHIEIGKSQVEQDNIRQAKATFREFAAKNPNHPLAPEALWRAARLELDGDLLEEAYESLRQLAKTYPQSDYADDALYWAGQAAYLADNYADAVATWDILVDNYSDSDLFSFGAYWQARALLALGQDETVETLLQMIASRSDEYYGLRARDLLTGSQPHSVPLALPTSAALAREQVDAEVWLSNWLELSNSEKLSVLSAQIRDDLAFQKGQALLELGLRAEAMVEFEKVKDNWWDNGLAIYQLSLYFKEQGLGRLSIVTAARLIVLSPANLPEEAPIFIQRLFYPIYFADLLFAEADALNLDPALLLAIMRQESLFEQSAESFAGARGLMQVMPGTGDYVAERSNFGGFDIDQLWLPYISIKFGAWYIDQQLGIFDGNQFAALAAYNAGPGNVLEWIKKSDDLDIFVESIPFRESRLYIRRIYVNLAAYRRIYGIPSNTTRLD